MNVRGYIRVRTDGTIPGDWTACCRLCGHRLWAGDWTGCMVWAHGHLAVIHEGEWRDRCGHELQAHQGDRSWCLACGADTKAAA